MTSEKRKEKSHLRCVEKNCCTRAIGWTRGRLLITAFFIILFSLFFCTSCPLPFFDLPGTGYEEVPPIEMPEAPPAGMGYFSLNINTAARTILPTAPVFKTYKLAFTSLDLNNSHFDEYRPADDTIENILLFAGRWGLTVTAYTAGIGDAGERPEDDTAVAMGVIEEFIIGAGVAAGDDVTLYPLETGDGTFRWTITYPAGVTITEANMFFEPSSTTVPLTGSSDPADTILAAGYYSVKITLKSDDGKTASMMKILHIRPNMVSEFSYTAFTASNFSGTHDPSNETVKVGTEEVDIVATAEVDDKLIVDISGLAGTGAVYYEWYRGDVLISRDSSYTIEDADAGAVVTVKVNRAGYNGSITSDAVTVKAVYSFEPNGDGTIKITGLLEPIEDIIIPVYINGLRVTAIADEAFRSETGITSVIIPEGVTSIGESAFVYCSNLTSITIPESVTSIGEYAFAACSSLTSIIIPEGVTSIDRFTFYECISLTSIIIPESITSIGERAFLGCSNLKSITIPASVKTIGGYAFHGCSRLTSIIISEGVTSIGQYAFYGCSSFTSIIIPTSVNSIGEFAFYDCDSLTSVTFMRGYIDISSSSGPSKFPFVGSLREAYGAGLAGTYVLSGDDWTKALEPDESDFELSLDGNTYTFTGFTGATGAIVIPGEINGKKVTAIANGAFDGNKAITSVIIQEGVTSIGDDAFYGCSSLTSIIIPEGVTSIGSWAFDGCTSLTNITIPESVTSIGIRTFAGCTSLTSITIPEGVTSIGNSAFDGCTSLTSITIPEGVTSIGNSTFAGCTSLTSITIPEGVTSIVDRAFSGCENLSSITIPESVASIGLDAFTNCNSLTSVTFMGADPPNMSNFSFPSGANLLAAYEVGGKGTYVLSGGNWSKSKSDFELNPDGESYTINGLTDAIGDIIIPSEINGIPVTTIAANAFMSSSITSVKIPDSVTTIGDMAFAYCDNLTSIEIPDSVTSIGGWAFAGLSKLTSVTIPTSIDSISEGAFHGSGLTSITIPGNVTSIGSLAFRNCLSLAEVIIEEGVTYIDRGAFEACSFSSITIPASVGSIEAVAFVGCDNLTSITFEGSNTDFYGDSFPPLPDLNSSPPFLGGMSLHTAYDGDTEGKGTYELIGDVWIKK